MCRDRPKCAAGMRRRTWNISQTEPPQPTSSQQPIGGTNTIPPPARTAPPPARAASVHAPFGCAARRTRAADALRCCRRDGNPGRRCIKSCQVRLPPRAPPPCAPPPHRNCSRTPRCPAPRARCKCACAFRPRGAPHARSRRSALLPAGRQPWAPMQQELPGAPPPRPPVRRLCPRPPVSRRHTATVAARRTTAAPRQTIATSNQRPVVAQCGASVQPAASVLYQGLRPQLPQGGLHRPRMAPPQRVRDCGMASPHLVRGCIRIRTRVTPRRLVRLIVLCDCIRDCI
jgi:hypothetical protein